MGHNGTSYQSGYPGGAQRFPFHLIFFWSSSLALRLSSKTRHISRNQVILHSGVIFPYISMDHWSIQQQESKPFQVLDLLLINKNHLEIVFCFTRANWSASWTWKMFTRSRRWRTARRVYHFEDLWFVRKMTLWASWMVGGGLHHFFRFWIFLQSVWSSLAYIADGDSGHLLGYLRARSRVAPSWAPLPVPRHERRTRCKVGWQHGKQRGFGAWVESCWAAWNF